jgi:transcriptional regulator with XRE-family HTH domain
MGAINRDVSRALGKLSPAGYSRASARRLALRIIHFRERIGLSQVGLAEASGISRSTISALESGQFTGVLMQTLECVAAGLRISLAVLLGGHPGTVMEVAPAGKQMVKGIKDPMTGALILRFAFARNHHPER